MRPQLSAVVISVAFLFGVAPASAGGPGAIASRATRKVTRAIARVTNERVLHPQGDAYAGTLELGPKNVFGRSAGQAQVVFRGSRGARLPPQPLPNALGAALRVPTGRKGAEDILMVTVG